jgi:DnaJ-class molecular chaperone
MQAKTFTVRKKWLVKFVEILEIDSSANTVEIKRAFLQLAKKYHPDVNSSPNA